MKNKKVKQMLFDVIVKGRKAIWYGEESEVFAANSMEQIEEHFGEDLLSELTENDGDCVLPKSKSYKFWWKPCAFEIGIDDMKGKPVINKDGTVNPYYESLPLICGVYGDKEEIVQVATSYN